MAKVGDTVRYLNSVGGGKIVKIEGNIAYVDEDGFETPVLLKECVVVSVANDSKVTDYEAPVVSDIKPVATKEVKDETDLPVIETPQGDKLNVVLAFEPRNLLKLSETAIDAFLVNDSNYFLYFTYSTSEEGEKWKVRYAGVIEPNIQLLLQEMERDDFSGMDRITVQIIAFKRDKEFSLKKPLSIELKFDATKFFRRHCFKQDEYFDNDVIALHLVKDDVPLHNANDSLFDKLKDNFNPEIKTVDRPRKRPVIKKTKSVTKGNGPIVVDLHINELLDSTAGLSNSEILNLQIDEFRRIMDENLKKKGQKLIFIHGKGEGVLRQALLKELNHRYKNHDIQDASFREYGFGATQVTIR